MEKIKVNMSPNPLDVQTIHASQNDGEARQWEFELHNNGELIDTSDVKEQMVFKAYKGGTEELLPSSLLNGSVDLGSLTWEYQSEYSRFRASFTGFKPSASQYVSGNILCAKYTTSSMQDTQTVNNTIAIGASGINYVYIKDTSYADATTFKESLQGVYLWYETTDSTPTTSPFIGDIRYPHGLLTDQEFLYRESPTEEDGLAKVTDIKGNTLVWNQLVQNGNFADTSKWAKGSGASSLAISNNEAVITIGGVWNNDIRQYQGASFISGHKYFASFEAKATVPITVALTTFNVTPEKIFATLTDLQTTFKKIASIVTAQSNATDFRIVLDGSGISYVGETFTVRNVQIIDLTAMGLDISSPSEFTSLFPLSYYSYNQGSLLSFMGNGIKTVGFNQWDEQWEHGSLGNNGENTGSSSYPEIRSVNYIPILPNTSYYLKTPVVTIVHYYGSADLNNYKGNQYLGGSQILNIPTGTNYIRFRTIGSYGDYKNDICLNISDSSRNGEYEPYTSSTLSLPISTYFPSGMKSAGNVYDELTESKAISRIGAVDLGSLTWSYVNQQYNIFQADLTDMKANADWQRNVNFCSSMYHPSPSGMSSMDDLGVRQVGNNLKQIIVRNTAYTDANTFKTAMNGVYLYYELATPTETPITTASLVTENAEIPLSNEDGALIGKCTEQLSENPGFIDAKIKLSDADGECYSNKIQLHVERSPQ